ncbi:ATP-binding protein [Nocardia brasiliensis]
MDGLHQGVPSLQLEFSAVAEELGRVREALRSWLAQAGIEQRFAYDLLLAVNEACSNSIEHGHGGDGGPITLRAYADTVIRVVVSDTGHWLDRPPDRTTDRGRGLAMMRALVPDIRVTSDESGTTVEFVAPRGDVPVPRDTDQEGFDRAGLR